MTRAARKPLVVTAARIEVYLDKLAQIMEAAGDEAELCLPIWRALERELAKRQEAEAILASARARLRRSSDQMEAQSS